MTDASTYIQKALETNTLRESVFSDAIQTLHLPSGSRGLDAGCGIGLQALMLAEAVGPAGHVTGLDISPELLLYGEEMVKKSALSKRITFRKGDVNNLPFDDDTFDWVWSADCVGYPVAQLLPMLKELARVIRPDGSLAILAWSSQQFLPGYPLLEARLNATCSTYTPFVKGKNPESNFLRALRWFDEAELDEATAKTFVGDVQAPLNTDIRRALFSLFEMLWGERRPEVTPEDWAEYQRLCVPESVDFILDLPGYYAFFTYSMFQAKVRE